MVSPLTLAREDFPWRFVSTGGSSVPLTEKGVPSPLPRLICGGDGGLVCRYYLNIGFCLFLIAAVVGCDGGDRLVADRILD